MTTNFKKIIIFLALFIFLTPFLSEAISIPNPLESESFLELIDKITTFVFYVAVAITPIMIIISAFYFLTSGGDHQKVSQAKKLLLYTIIGLFIILLSRGIIYFIGQLLGVSGTPPPPPPF
jgi:uncharacterized membrane protein